MVTHAQKAEDEVGGRKFTLSVPDDVSFYAQGIMQGIMQIMIDENSSVVSCSSS